MNATYIRVEFARHLRDGYNLVFSLLMPSAMYVLFGNIPSYTDQELGFGNVKFYVMVSMAAYGAAVSTVAIAGTVATETMQGWGRQVALTRMPPATFVSSKMLVATTVAAISSALVFALGAATGAQVSENWIWAASYLITIGGSLIFACYGIGVGMVFKSESALGLAGADGLLRLLRQRVHAAGGHDAGHCPVHPDVRLRGADPLPAVARGGPGNWVRPRPIVDASD
ncbi:ABC transporter permease [Arthrobacter sp. JCM 19049]|uniref:ABC transporter permease n=1 Tax=Arthrobacter sp. JCM 19049 TaxID=1460643 RepID=UPI0006D1FA62|nr:ABC transporter permease [Arthrobacter sp. JCM 19049]